MARKLTEYTIRGFSCGCRVSGTDIKTCGIAYCPQHKSAPDLYEACKAQHEAIDILFAMLIMRDKKFFPSKSGKKPWEAIKQGNKALAKAEGKNE